jgi:hypothetical protein
MGSRVGAGTFPSQRLTQIQRAAQHRTMFGTVADSTGAAIPNAALTFTQTQTNFTRQTTRPMERASIA